MKKIKDATSYSQVMKLLQVISIGIMLIGFFFACSTAYGHVEIHAEVIGDLEQEQRYEREIEDAKWSGIEWDPRGYEPSENENNSSDN